MADILKIGVNGACGRMGQRIVALVHEDPELKVALALDSPKHPKFGQDAGDIAGIGPIGVPVSSEIVHAPDAIIDFSTPAGLRSVLPQCAERGIPLVVCTTGLTQEQQNEVSSAAQTTAIVWSPSMSLAVNLVMKLVQDAARTLKNISSGVDVEIIERHHRYKEDAPSGTALKFGEIIAKEMGQTDHIHGREGRIGKRPPTEIGYHALRTGDNVGEHTIVFGLIGETIDLTVRGHTRDSYAFGALMAAKFLVGNGAGLYSVSDVLGL
ncbi:MAG TPA: 4-hydroxy-tetrahydrodipicolinate reductase [Planctomycetaceae bacterium]|nr:4-hydroxy-tetrahydrodipicolinate reductase [Planctomycetaceae bacterium]